MVPKEFAEKVKRATPEDAMILLSALEKPELQMVAHELNVPYEERNTKDFIRAQIQSIALKQPLKDGVINQNNGGASSGGDGNNNGVSVNN